MIRVYLVYGATYTMRKEVRIFGLLVYVREAVMY